MPERSYLLRKVASFGVPEDELTNVYILFIRSLLEESAMVWHSRLTKENIDDLERVQKSAMRIILEYLLKKSTLKHYKIVETNYV